MTITKQDLSAGNNHMSPFSGSRTIPIHSCGHFWSLEQCTGGFNWRAAGM